jgi:CDP-diacylglycerol--glycerol-3-phosphate 3-phosphatidyltransferase
MTLANKITLGRFAITIVYFVLLAICGRQADWTLLYVAFFLFLAAVVGDGLDGYYARKYHQETNFGRIADPFVDKIMICGSFVFFLSIQPLAEIVTGWMVMIIIAREFLVSAIRGVAEAQGIPLAVSAWGKTKMVVQSFVVATAVFYAAWVHHLGWARVVMEILVWITIAVTAISGLMYVLESKRLFAGKKV